MADGVRASDSAQTRKPTCAGHRRRVDVRARAGPTTISKGRDVQEAPRFRSAGADNERGFHERGAEAERLGLPSPVVAVLRRHQRRARAREAVRACAVTSRSVGTSPEIRQDFAEMFRKMHAPRCTKKNCVLKSRPRFVHAKTSAKKPVAPETAASGVADAPAARPTNAVSTTFRTGSSASATYRFAEELRRRVSTRPQTRGTSKKRSTAARARCERRRGDREDPRVEGWRRVGRRLGRRGRDEAVAARAAEQRCGRLHPSMRAAPYARQCCSFRAVELRAQRTSCEALFSTAPQRRETALECSGDAAPRLRRCPAAKSIELPEQNSAPGAIGPVARSQPAPAPSLPPLVRC